MKGDANTVKLEMKKSDEYGKWLSNPLAAQLNLTATFWLKMDRTIETDLWRNILLFDRWILSYNGKKKLLKAFIASNGDTGGVNGKMNVQCSVPQIQR